MAIGAGIVILIQALIAVLLAKYVFDHPYVKKDLAPRWPGDIFNFRNLLFIQAKKNKRVKHKETSGNAHSIFKGMLIAALNLFPIPYFIAIAGTMNLSSGVSYDWSMITAFALAASSGSFTSLYLYVFFFNRIEQKAEKFSKYSNYFMALLMLVLIIITVIRILNS